MFKKLDSLMLKQRLALGYVTVIAMMVVSGILSIIGIGLLRSSTNNYIDEAQRADTAVKICRIDVNIAARNVREMVLNEDKSTYSDYKTTVKDLMDEVGVELKELKKTGVVDDKLYQEYEIALSDWAEIGYEIMDEVEAGNADVARKEIFEKCAPALEKAVELSKEIDKATDDAKADEIKESRMVAAMGIICVIVFIVIAIGVALAIGKRIIRSIMVPISQVENVVKELSEGNLHTDLQIQSNDEIGMMAKNLRASIETLSAYVDDIGRAMNEFANGNFDVRPEVEWKGDFVSILDSFTKFEMSMCDMVKGIQRVADQVTNGAEQVAAASMDLAQGATEQAGITQELTATIEDVSEHVSQNAKSAKSISKEVGDTGEAIASSNGKMQEMVASMKEINDSSQEISKIIAAINDIASQTNLLALNASIEAARAGEAGKGFAVVADQVSVLAAQSAEAAKESTALIECSVQAVEKGMIVADQAAKQLENVVETTEALINKVNQVAFALEEQAASMSQVNEGVGQINDVVQTNSATSEECAAASQEMSGQAETLENQIRQFKVLKL